VTTWYLDPIATNVQKGEQLSVGRWRKAEHAFIYVHCSKNRLIQRLIARLIPIQWSPIYR
jgi:hypothetical protein